MIIRTLLRVVASRKSFRKFSQQQSGKALGLASQVDSDDIVVTMPYDLLMRRKRKKRCQGNAPQL